MRHIAYPSPSSPLLRIFIQQIRRLKPRRRSSSSSSSSSSEGGGDGSGDGGGGAWGRHRGCLADTVGRPVGVVTVEVVVLVPTPALRRAVEGREGAVVVVAVVAGRVRVEVTGRGRLAVGRVLVDVVRAVVVMGVEVASGGGAVVVGAVPVPATGGSVNPSKASSTLTEKDKLKSSMSRSNWAGSTGRVNSATMSVIVRMS